MKNIVRFVFIVLAAVALTTSAFGAAAGAGQQDIGPEPQPTGAVFTVYPTGVDDTENIRQAFELAKAAGPGSTVKLAPGNFKARLMEIWDFDGYFKGSGEEVTVIDTFPDQECQSLVDANRWPGLFMFFRGYPRVSDLKIHITPANPCLVYNFPLGGPDFNVTWIIGMEIMSSPVNPLTDCNVLQKESLRGLVERVTIEAEPWDVYEQWTLWGGLWFGGQGSTQSMGYNDCPYRLKFTEGDFTIRNTTIRNSFFGLSPNNLANSNAKISDSVLEGNEFGIPVNDLSGSELEILNNVFEAGNVGIIIGIGGYNPVPYIDAPSAFNIHHNEFNTFGDSIQLFDYDKIEILYPPQGSHIKANIHHNHITLNPDYSWAIFGEWLDDAVIHHNTIDGNSEFAMVFGLFGQTRGLKIMANDLHNYTATANPYKILLGPGTENYKVTVDEQNSVLDLGTNNTVNEKIKKGQFAFDAAFVEMLSQKMAAGKEFMPWSPRYQVLPLLKPVNHLYMPVVQAK